METGAGLARAFGVLSLHLGSFRGGSSFLVMGKSTSGLATGREEPPSSLFKYDWDILKWPVDAPIPFLS